MRQRPASSTTFSPVTNNSGWETMPVESDRRFTIAADRASLLNQFT
ncbi:MAG: hypothetical protein ACYTXT_31540 [Nostoc sp.]|nr:hypothetical protein [Nostoc sp. 'Peltigera membranacea cyanobiont' 213]